MKLFTQIIMDNSKNVIARSPLGTTKQSENTMCVIPHLMRNPGTPRKWIPAFAGMTEGAGMTRQCVRDCFVPLAITGRIFRNCLIVFVVLFLEIGNSALAQNTATEAKTFTISGKVGLEGVTMKGLPDQVVTDSEGSYKAVVPYGFSGIVTPWKEGYTFTPASLAYNNITSDRNNQDYVATKQTFTISGNMMGIAGVEMRGLPGNPVTDATGAYSDTVPYGWSGTVTPTKRGLKFEPPSITYSKVTADIQRNSNYVNTRAATSIGSTGTRKVVIIPATQTQAGVFDATIEDMSVMLHILDQKLINEPSTIRGVLTDYGEIFGRENLTSKAVYIQEYGVLFLMEVNFPLVLNGKSQSKPEQSTDTNADTVWQQAKEQVFSPRNNTSTRSGSQTNKLQARVEQLINDLIETMKHATNIRQIDPNEWIIFNITGVNQSSSQIRTSTGGQYGSGWPGTGYGTGYGTNTETMGLSSSDVLTIRAKKADVDAFAKGQMSSEQFRQKVTVCTYSAREIEGLNGTFLLF